MTPQGAKPPSAAALRAATAAFRAHSTLGDWPTIQNAIALAIDEASGLPELVEALTRARRRVCLVLCMTHEVLPTSHHPDCQEFRAALRLAEQGREGIKA